MGQLATWGLVGFGNIGREVTRQLGQPAVAKRLELETQPRFIAEAKGILKADGHTPTGYKNLAAIAELPDVTFIAIPSSNDGKVAYGYIEHILKRGKMAITAEKGALANHYGQLRAASDDFKRFGITATVGGGTRLLSVAKQYCQDLENISQIHLALNGTLSAIMDWVAPLAGSGLSLEAAAKQAVAKGFAEPGSASATAIIKAEAEGDIPKKLAIFCNSVGLSHRLLNWHKLHFSLSEQEISQAVNPKQPRRFIVSLYPLSSVGNSASVAEDGRIGGFDVQHDGWQLIGGFRRLDANPLFGALAALTGPGNGLVIGLGPRISDGVYAVTGPGAGVNPTANAMIDDFVRLRKL